jgi:hypothetical protein
LNESPFVFERIVVRFRTNRRSFSNESSFDFEPIAVRFEPIVVRFEPITVRFEPIADADARHRPSARRDKTLN